MAKVTIEVNAKDNASSILKKIGAELERTSVKGRRDFKSLSKGADSLVQGITGLSIASLGAAGAIAGMAAGAKKAIDAASNMNETVNKTRVVFGGASDEVLKFGESAALSMGMSKQAALAAASTFGNLFVSMGMAQDKSMEMSTSLVKLAGDLASFNNIDPGEALEKLRAGIVGEAEPLRALGVNLTEVAVQERALAMGLAATNKELTVADKAQARYALILEQTATAQGDFARTADGAANQERILRAQLEDMAANLGANLLPAWLEVITALNTAAGAFNLVTTASAKLATATVEHEGEVRKTAASYKEYEAEMARALSIQGKAVRVTEDGIQVFKVGRGYVQATGEEYGLLTESMWNYIHTSEYQREEMRAAGNGLLEVAEATIEGAESIDYWVRRGEEQANAAKRSSVEIKNLADAQALYNQQTDLFTEASGRAAAAQQNFNMEFGDKTVSKLEQAGIKGEDYEKALEMIDTRLGTQYLAEKKANDELDRAIQKYKETGNIEEFDKALGENKDTWEELDENLQAAKQGLDNARFAFDAFILDIAKYNGMEIKINVKTQTYGAKTDWKREAVDPDAEVARASGGPVMSGRAYMVGEHGPEVLYMPFNGYVQPHGGPVGAYAAGKDGGARNVTYNIFSVDRPGRIQSALKISELMGGAA